jgi:hypothetical protein
MLLQWAPDRAVLQDRECWAPPTLLDVVVGQGAAVLQLLAGKDQTLLIRRDTCMLCGNIPSSMSEEASSASSVCVFLLLLLVLLLLRNYHVRLLLPLPSASG